MFDDAKAEFWGDLQRDFYTENSVLFLANQSLESVISTDGRKAHKPILSKPIIGDYTPHNDIAFKRKRARKQTLEVNQFPYAAEIIDITEKMQTPYDLLGHSGQAIRKGLLNRVEQLFIAEIANAYHKINSGTAFVLAPSNVGDVIEEADGKLGSFDAPVDSGMKAFVVGPRTAALLRKVRADKETALGDSTDSRGVIGPWRGWTVVVNNNLPWSGTLALATAPTDGDYVTIMGVRFRFKTTPTDPGDVDIGDAATTRANLKAAIEGGSGAGTAYIELDETAEFIIRNKRRIKCTADANMAFTGHGDIVVTDSLTAPADGWSNQEQKAGFMVRGAIDLVMQFEEYDFLNKAENRFADKPKGVIGLGTEMFEDGSLLSVEVPLDVSGWKA